MRKFRLALLLYVAFDFLILGNVAGLFPLTPLAAAQNVPSNPPIRPTPDCLLTGAPMTATGTKVFDNRGMGCTTWHLVYSNTGFSALNIALQSADNSGGIPGTFNNWGTSGGTLAIGTSLPLTAITSGQATGYKYRPFVQLNLSSVTGSGSVDWMLYGYRPGGNVDSSSSGANSVQGFAATGTALASAGNPVFIGCAGSAAGPGSGQVGLVSCGNNGSILTLIAQTPGDGLAQTNLVGAYSVPGGAGVYPAVMPFWLGNGVWDKQWYCSKTAKLNALAAATTQIVAAVASQKIRVCSAVVSNNNATATTLKMVEGTGANCVTGQTDVTALMNIGATSTAPISLQWLPGGAPITTTAADALCLTSSAASSLEITITYDQH